MCCVISYVGTAGPLVFAPVGQALTAECVIMARSENFLPMADALFGHRNYCIQLDNANRHTSNSVTQFAQVGVNLLFQSTNSPDMQPFKNV